MKYGSSIRMFLLGNIKCLKYKFIVIGMSKYEGYNAFISKIQYCTKICLLIRSIFHFSHVSEPLLPKTF